MMGTYIYCLLLFVWVLYTIQKVDNNWFKGTYIHRVLVIDGNLYTQSIRYSENSANSTDKGGLASARQLCTLMFAPWPCTLYDS